MPKYKVQATQYVNYDAYIDADSADEAYKIANSGDCEWVLFEKTPESGWEIYGDTIEEISDDV